MPPFETARLWKTSLALQAETDKEFDVRERLRSAFMRFRDRAAMLAGEIARDLPDYTVHDISHIDALWHLADLIAGDRIRLTPCEAFVLGGAFLIHDLGNGLAAYPDGIASLTSGPNWDDAVASVLRRTLGRAPTPEELRRPCAAVEKEAVANLLRRLHAEHAERLALVSWSEPKTKEQYHLIEDAFLRLHFGKLIGLIAHSHWWPARKLLSDFDSVIGPPAGFPREWKIDPLILACLLRVADAAHMDSARAPSWLKLLRRPSTGSAAHWEFQERLNQPISQGDRLLFTSAPFAIADAEAWWLCFDTLQILDQELGDVDSILADSRQKQLAVRGVHGAGQPDRLRKWVKTDGWLPVDTRIRVGDVAHLVKELGGGQLYGEDRLVPLRELIQNSSDAVRARRFLQSWPQDRGEITVRVGTDEVGHFIEVNDNGIGMSEAVMVGYLLDFGRSFWSGREVPEHLPGLLASAFEPTGKYGIGFFSVFMWGGRVRVTSRAFKAAEADTHVLEFTAGLDSRPLLRKATPQECFQEGGTSVRVWVDKNPEDRAGVLYLPELDELNPEERLRATCAWLCPSLDANLFVQRFGEAKTLALSASDWKTIPNDELVRRLAARLPPSDGEDEDEEQNPEERLQQIISKTVPMLRPVVDTDGSLLGRLALVPSGWARYWDRLGVVTVGGLRSASILGAAGVLLGAATTASRHTATPLIPIGDLRRWAHDQEHLVADGVTDVGALFQCAETIRALGTIPEILPIAEGCDGPKTASDIRNWTPVPEEVILVHYESLFLLRRTAGPVQLFPNVLSVNVGFRPFLSPEHGSSLATWPLTDYDEFHKLTLMGAVAELIADLWGVQRSSLMDLVRGRGEKRVAIGTVGGVSVRLIARVLRRSNKPKTT